MQVLLTVVPRLFTRFRDIYRAQLSDVMILNPFAELDEFIVVVLLEIRTTTAGEMIPKAGAARRTEFSAIAATQIGGQGFWIGRGLNSICSSCQYLP